MEVFIVYLLAFIMLIVGTAAIYMPLIPIFPYTWLYRHYHIRKPFYWTVFLGLLAWIGYQTASSNEFPLWAIPPLVIAVLAMVLTYKMHQDKAFPAVDFPEITTNTANLPLDADMEMAVIEYEGVTKCYPLDYVVHHHIVNDRFNTKTVSLTYCAMCRSIIPFDVTDIGPLFVGSFYNANMIVADRKTQTFFQQSTFQSLIGKLHPTELQMIPFQVLTWSEVKETIDQPQVVRVTEADFKAFELPIPGIWKKIMASERTPGLSKKKKDKTFPVRTRVIGITDKSIHDSIVYLRKEVLKQGIVANNVHAFFLCASKKTVNAFSLVLDGRTLTVQLEDGFIVDSTSGTKWNLLGKHVSGDIVLDLQPIAVSDEYWFAWKEFHPTTELIRV